MHIFSCTPVQAIFRVRQRSQFCVRELPVRTRVYADRVRHCIRDYVLYVNIFLVLYYLILYYIKICDSG